MQRRVLAASRHAIYVRLGRRGLFLLLLGTVQAAYGAGLAASAAAPPGRPHWWPASTGHLGGLPLDFWAAVWAAVAALCLVTAWTPADQIGYAAGVLLNTGWSAFAVRQWLTSGEAGAWAPAVIYTGIAIGVLIVSGWPEPPKAPLIILPPPPDLGGPPEPPP